MNENVCDGHLHTFMFCSNHTIRTKALEEILEYSYHALIENKHLLQKQGEDALSIQIIMQLKMLGIIATHDEQVGGHCDITVRGKKHFLWIGEAKIHNSYKWLEDGFLQLSTRYATGGVGQDRGEIIIYCFIANAVSVLENWKERLLGLCDTIRIEEDKIPTHFYFRSSHIAENTGTHFHTRHRIIPLFWKPKK